MGEIMKKDKKRNIRRITLDTKFCGIPLKDWPDPKPEENPNPKPTQSTPQSIIAKNMLINLKQTKLWDPVKSQWNGWMDENGGLGNSNRYADDQLLGVLTEFFVGDKDLAKNMHDALKHTELWDPDNYQWNEDMNENGKLEHSYRLAENQLLGVLTEFFVGDKDLAKNMLINLKQTELYDPVKSQWNWFMDNNGKLIDSGGYTDDQLLGVLAEYFVGDKDLAKNMLINLKQTVLWDPVKFQWNWGMDKNGKPESSNRYAYDQLLGVLAEFFVGDKDLAKNMLINLKHTELYDQTNSQWNWEMDENGKVIDSNRYAYAQLLGVLAEAVVGEGMEMK